MAIDPASYRDPAGQVHRLKDRIFRSVQRAGLKDYSFVRESGALPPLIKAGMIISGEEVEPGLLGDLAQLMKWRHHLSWRILSHIILPSRLQAAEGERTHSAGLNAKQRGLARSNYSALLAQLRNWIGGLVAAGHENTVWSDYASDNSYEAPEARAKRDFVAEFTSAVRPALMLDIGCNTGDYAKVALSSGAGAVVGLDADHGALEQAFSRARAEKLNFLPLYQDSANPSPSQGWNNVERQSLLQRSRDMDAVTALAFEHHLAIGRNIPLPETVRWITGLAPQGVIEFVPKEDPTVQKMLALRDDIFPDYSCENFTEILAQCARIVQQKEISSTGRRLFWFERDR